MYTLVLWIRTLKRCYENPCLSQEEVISFIFLMI
uniref:Uncharacterized protein n=1 Tax=Nelumbo nucifera TaxID=4432 RepID=A0A822XGR5_NELNU|nr:TPA_asm: hypothetical protein HUJ06_019669 [Nelumbo nucifera]